MLFYQKVQRIRVIVQTADDTIDSIHEVLPLNAFFVFSGGDVQGFVVALRLENVFGVVGEIHQQNEKLGTTLNVFSTLNQEVQKVVGEINVISGELDHIENYKTDVVEKIDGLTEISQNNAASTEETAATMDQLAEIVEDCRQATTQLNEIAGSLNANAKKFQLG